MKLSSAALTVAAISLLSTTHAAPLAFKNGEITGRPHHRRGSDLSDVSDISDITTSSRADEALEALNIGFEPASHHLILPRILNFIKRQVSSAAGLTSVDTSTATAGYSTGTADSGTADKDPVTSLMSPDLESYGFASEGGLDTHLAPVRQIRE